MKIIFMGTPDYATTIFDRLIKENLEILALFTQPDKKVGRKQILTPPHIKQYCLNNNINIPIFQPKTLKDKKIIKIIRDLNPDFIIVAAYGQILPKEILEIATCINLHASLLPKYRGASPIQSAILNNDKYTGVTAMLMDIELDSGDILAWQYCEIKDKKAAILFDELSLIAADVSLFVLNNFNKIKPKKQNEILANYSQKIKKEDGLISFNESADTIYKKFKAYHFWPGIYLNNNLKLKEIKLVEKNSKNIPGKILKIDKNSIIVGCKKGSIEISKLQPPSKKIMNAIDYLRGKRLNKEDLFI